MWLRTLALSLCPMAFLVPLAQAQAAQQPANQPPVFHANAEEVSLDLVVHDKKNRPVVNLKPEEIAVTDNGSRVTLTSLRLISGASADEHLTTLVFDRLDPGVTKRARDIAGKMLALVPKEGFSLAVLNIEGRLRLQQGFTSDRKALEQAVIAATQPGIPGQISPVSLPEKEITAEAQTGADPSGKAVSARERALSQTLLSALLDSGRIVQDQHAQPALAGLLALVQSQQKFAERKAIIYFTHGRQVDSRAKETLDSIVGAANRNGVSIYAIDLNALDRGTQRLFAADMHISAVPGAAAQATTRGALSAPSEVFRDNTDTTEYVEDRPTGPFQNLAETTGGSYISGADNLQKSLERMMQDLTTYYKASYVPNIQEYDGKFRSIGVQSLRPGLKIRSSAGYFAIPPDAGTHIRPFELPLLNILAQLQLPTDIAFHAAILRLGDLPNGDGNTLALEAPLSDVQIREDASTKLYSAHLSIVAQIKDKTGTVLQHFSADTPRRGALEGIEKARSEAITMQRHFVAAPGEYVLEAVVLDRNSGKAGAQRMAFNIPNPSGGPSLSDMVLVQRMEPFDAKTDPLEPLLQGNNKVTPNLSGVATRDAKAVSVFFITHPDPHAPEAATLNLQLLKDGEPLNRTPAALRPVASGGAETHLATFPVSSRAAGLYQVKATITQGGKTAESTTSFTLAGNGETESSDADLPVAPMESRPLGPLDIKLPVGRVRPPAPSELKSILADATRHAIGYSDALPNFVCVEVTNRSVDMRGQGKWQHTDKFAELLTYRDNTEERTMLEFNGQKGGGDRADLTGWLSHGEFGSTLKSVFQPSSKAEFQWKETGALGDGTVQVFDYRVARENSKFDIHVSNSRQATVGFHGQVFVDSATRSVRRITLVADDLPEKFPIHATSISLDYDYIVINKHDYLLPVGGQVSLREGRRKAVLNEIEFRDYRRFGSTAKIVDYHPEEKP